MESEHVQCQGVLTAFQRRNGSTTEELGPCEPEGQQAEAEAHYPEPGIPQSCS